MPRRWRCSAAAPFSSRAGGSGPEVVAPRVTRLGVGGCDAAHTRPGESVRKEPSGLAVRWHLGAIVARLGHRGSKALREMPREIVLGFQRDGPGVVVCLLSPTKQMGGWRPAMVVCVRHGLADPRRSASVLRPALLVSWFLIRYRP
ncbi:hypothetical protein NMD1_01057 [Novosphingobium sp. MD-1]|nr:hypothetical protein NMD1_01057 [Novosphingobium sp. MD-1]